MKKRVLFLITAFMLVFCFVSCGSETSNDATPTPTVKYNVSFVTNCTEVLSNVSVEQGKSLEKPKALEKSGYQFFGWYADAEFETAEVTFPFFPTRDTVLFARWVSNTVVKASTLALYVMANGVKTENTYKYRMYYDTDGGYTDEDNIYYNENTNKFTIESIVKLYIGGTSISSCRIEFTYGSISLGQGEYKYESGMAFGSFSTSFTFNADMKSLKYGTSLLVDERNHVFSMVQSVCTDFNSAFESTLGFGLA